MSDEEEAPVKKTGHDTFLELQEELVRQYSEGAKDEESRKTKEKDLAELVKELAEQAGFRVEAVLGIGGMGAVVRATDLRLKREVALKFLPPQLTADAKKVAELRREAEIASRIKHENVVAILSWHEVENVPFYAMELVEGESLDEQVRRRGKLPVHDALRIIMEVTRGVEALHHAGIIHRDIKPQNILIARDGRIKITDFGISREQNMITIEAQQNKIAGTPQFMAPEQARGEAATKHSDIYSLGASLYYALTGRAPVKSAPSIKEQLKIVGEGRPMPITHYHPKLNRKVARVVMRALSSTPPRRAFDINAFRQDLEQAYIDQLKGEKAGRYLGRKVRALTPILTLAIGIAAGFVIGMRAEREASQSAQGPAPGGGAGDSNAGSDSLSDSAEIAEKIAAAGAHDVQALRTIVSLDSEAEEPARLLEEYEETLASEDWVGVAECLEDIAAEVDRWVARQTAAQYAEDANSPIQEQARATLEALGNGDEEEIQKWRRVWLNYLQQVRNRE